MDQPLPDVSAFLPGQKEFGLAGQEATLGGIILSHWLRGNSPPPAQQAGGENLGVIEDEQITGLENLRYLAKRPVVPSPLHTVEHYHARSITLGQWSLGYKFGGKRVVKFLEKHQVGIMNYE
jgi:hypothetical protein